MNRIILCAAIAIGCLCSTGQVGAADTQSSIQLAQGIYIGPGGVDVDVEGRGPRRSYEDTTCARLRRACVYKNERGDEGMGNCRRYRRICR